LGEVEEVEAVDEVDVDVCVLIVLWIRDLVGNGGKKAAGISWIRHTSEKVCNIIDGFKLIH
jgi:hypothetical protein